MNRQMVVALHEPSMSGANIGLFEILSILSENHDFIILSPSYGPIISRILIIKPDTVVIIRDYRWWMSSEKSNFNLLFTIKQTLKNLIAVRDIYLILKDKKIDIFFSNTIVINVGAILARKLRKHHFWYFHEFGKLDHNFNFLYGEKKSIKFIKKLGGDVFSNSKITAKFYSECLKKPIHFLYQPVLINEPPKPIQNELEKIRMIIYGRITQSKGHKFALHALYELNKTDNKLIELTIMGNCDDKKFLLEIEEYIKENNIEKQVRILSHEANPFKIVNEHDIVLNFSENEAFGRMNIEAMKLGKILVSTDRGSSSELIIHGFNGFIFEHNNLKAFIDLINEISHLDKSQIQDISNNAIISSNDKFNIINTSSKLNEFFRNR